MDPTGQVPDLVAMIGTGMRYEVAPYIAARHPEIASLEDLIAWNGAEPITRAPFGQDFLVALAQMTEGLSAADHARLGEDLAAAATAALDRAFAASGAEVLVSTYSLHAPFYATAGWPAVTVPMGLNDAGWPMGATLIGRKGDDRPAAGLRLGARARHAAAGHASTDRRPMTAPGAMPARGPARLEEGRVMDLMALVRSIEELLYEIASWVLFFPLTLWYCVRRPIRMMRYAASELTDKTEHRFAEALSPPILLVLTLGLIHLFEPPPPKALAEAMAWLFEDDRNLLTFRAGVFGLLPLVCATMDLRRKGTALTRETLRPAFYSHCYLATPFILAVDLALIIAPLPMSGFAVITLTASCGSLVRRRAGSLAEARDGLQHGMGPCQGRGHPHCIHHRPVRRPVRGGRVVLELMRRCGQRRCFVLHRHGDATSGILGDREIHNCVGNSAQPLMCQSCPSHSSGNPSSRSSSCNSAGCRPSRIASTISGASSVSRRTRLT